MVEKKPNAEATLTFKSYKMEPVYPTLNQWAVGQRWVTKLFVLIGSRFCRQFQFYFEFRDFKISIFLERNCWAFILQDICWT